MMKEKNARVFIPTLVILLAAFMASYFNVGFTGQVYRGLEDLDRCEGGRGDISNDGYIGGVDIGMLDDIIDLTTTPSYFKRRYSACADINGDGEVDDTDLAILIQEVQTGEVHEDRVDDLDPANIVVAPYDGPCEIGEKRCKGRESRSWDVCTWDIDTLKTRWEPQRLPLIKAGGKTVSTRCRTDRYGYPELVRGNIPVA